MSLFVHEKFLIFFFKIRSEDIFIHIIYNFFLTPKFSSCKFIFIGTDDVIIVYKGIIRIST